MVSDSNKLSFALIDSSLSRYKSMRKVRSSLLQLLIVILVLQLENVILEGRGPYPKALLSDFGHSDIAGPDTSIRGEYSLFLSSSIENQFKIAFQGLSSIILPKSSKLAHDIMVSTVCTKVFNTHLTSSLHL